MKFQKKNVNKNYKLISSQSSKNCIINFNFHEDQNSKYKIYEEKLKNFLEGIKANKIKYNSLKRLFQYEDNFRLICDIYRKFLKSKIEIEILNFYLKSLWNFISLIHADEPIEELDKTLSIVNKYLRVKKFNKNNILFRIGDIGTKYYILLNGKAYTLVPRKYIKSMTFDEYRNHLYMLFIFGEDYLLEQTITYNNKSIDISTSDIECNDNKILRNIYKNNYSCNYNKYIKIINGDEHIMIEDYDEIENNNDINEKENNIDNNKKNKIKKDKYYKILKYFNKNFNFIKKDKNNLEYMISQLESIKEKNKEENEDNLSDDDMRIMKRKMKKLKHVKNMKNVLKIDEDFIDDIKNINSFNIGIPKDLLSRDTMLNSEVKYDGGELPTFFSRDKNNYVYYEITENNEENEKNNSLENLEDNNFNEINKKDFNNYYNALNLRRNLTIVGYTKVSTILPGMSFGELSLLSENHKRTSTIFIDQDSQIGRLSLNEYNNTIKTVRSKIRNDSINFLLSTKLFGDISYYYFLNKYWIYFQCKKIEKGQFLFKIGEECENVYIIYNGEIKLSTNINIDNIDDLIHGIKNFKKKKKSYYLNKINRKDKKNNNSIFERKQKYCLMIAKKGDILGLNDIVEYHNNTYICEGEVISDFLSYYEINRKLIFSQISKDIQSQKNNNGKNTALNIENISNIIKTKEDFMINKLNVIKISIEQRHNYLYLDKENNNNFYDSNKDLKNKNKINHFDDKNKCYNFINHQKNLSINHYNLKVDSINKNINQMILTHQSSPKNLISNSSNKLIDLNTINTHKNIDFSKINNIDLSKNFGNISPKDKNILHKYKSDTNINLKNFFNYNINLTLDISHKKQKNKKDINSNSKSINDIKNSSKNNIEDIEKNNIIFEKKQNNYFKPYEYPKIHDENNNPKNWDLIKKNKILKYPFLNEPNKLKNDLFNLYNMNKKKHFLNNYFFNIQKSISKRNNNNIEHDKFESLSFTKNNKFNIINNIHNDFNKLKIKIQNNNKLIKTKKIHNKILKPLNIKNKNEKIFHYNSSINSKKSNSNKKKFILSKLIPSLSNNNKLISKNISMKNLKKNLYK